MTKKNFKELGRKERSQQRSTLLARQRDQMNQQMLIMRDALVTGYQTGDPTILEAAEAEVLNMLDLVRATRRSR